MGKSRKGCEGVSPFQVSESEKLLWSVYQNALLKYSDSNDLKIYLDFIKEDERFKEIKNFDDSLKTFRDGVKRYFFFNDCKELKQTLKQTLGLKDEFINAIKKDKIDFNLWKIRRRFPSKRVSFHFAKFRDNYLIARGTDGVVRVWKNNNLIKEMGPKYKGQGEKGEIELKDNLLFYENKKKLLIFDLIKEKKIFTTKFPDKIKSLTIRDNQVIVTLINNQAQAIIVNKEDFTFSSITEPSVKSIKEILFEELIKSNILCFDGNLYYVPDKEINLKIKNNKKIEFKKEIKDIIKIRYPKCFVELKDKMKLIDCVVVFFYYNFFSFKEKLIEWEHIKNKLIPLSEYPVLSIHGVKKFDNFMAIGISDGRLKIYNKDGKLKLDLKTDGLKSEQFLIPNKSLEFEVFEDGYLISDGKDRFYGSKNWRDYVYIVDEDNVITNKNEPIYFDYLESPELFDEIFENTTKTN